MSTAERPARARSGWQIHLDPAQEAVAAPASGRPVIVVDDADLENEGDIVFGARFSTPSLMGGTIRYSSGVFSPRTSRSSSKTPTPR